MADLFSKPERSIVSWYTEIRHVHNVPVEDDLKGLIFKILKKSCSEDSIEKFKLNVYNFEKDLFPGETEIVEVLKLMNTLEETILIWHIATSLCDWQKGLPQNNDVEKNVKLSRILSRYCAYLLLSCPDLLPLHPSMARIVYMQLVKQLQDTLPLCSIL
ncbi:hypothetical protein SUGI_0372290 [Cryptomeria japonica]|nr:hypothetical protein SUGI_0372290 [Cryptomeria japonica]